MKAPTSSVSRSDWRDSSVAADKTWDAADPGPACKVDGLYGEYGRTWGRHFRGYSEAALVSLPRVTTETGVTVGGPITEEIQRVFDDALHGRDPRYLEWVDVVQVPSRTA